MLRPTDRQTNVDEMTERQIERYQEKASLLRYLWPQGFMVYSVFVQSFTMEQHALRNVNNCLFTNIYSYLEISGGISYNPYLNVVHFFNTRVN